MLPTHKRMAWIRRIIPALVWTCLLAGCSHDLARTSSDLLSPLPPDPAASEPLRPDTQSRGNALNGSAAGAGRQASGIPAPEALAPPARDGAKSGSSSDPNSAVPLLTLPEAIDIGLKNNPRLLAALAAIDRARGETTAAFAPFLPQIDMLTRYVATDKNILPGAPGPTGAVNISAVGPYQLAQSELQLQWTLYDFGRRAGHYGQASMREKSLQFQEVRARETVAFDVATSYLQVLEAVAFRRIARETVRRAQAVLEDVRARREGGVALRDDVLRGEVQLAESRDALVRAEDAEISALTRLNNALGRDASLPLRLDERVLPKPFGASLAECLERAATQRPEVGAARDRVAGARFGREAARGEFLPELYLKGSVGRIEGENVVAGFQEGAGIQLNVPLYYGGAHQGHLRTAEADIRQAQADAQGVLNDISVEVTVAHRDLRSAQTRVELARPAVEQSTEALRIVRGRYREGTATPTDVIAAETASTRAEQRYISARLDYLSALARLAYVTSDDQGGMCLPLTGPDPEDKAPGEAPDILPMPHPVPMMPRAEEP
jgi:outer membrane protein